MARTGQSYANAVSSNNNSAAGVSANAGFASANSINGLIGNAFKTYGYFAGNSSPRGQSSYDSNAFDNSMAAYNLPAGTSLPATLSE